MKIRIATTHRVDNAVEDELPYPYLRIRKLNEEITRIDKHWIRRYWDEPIEGETKRLNEILFYPSDWAMEQIRSMRESKFECGYENSIVLNRMLDKLEDPDYKPIRRVKTERICSNSLCF